MVSLLQRRRASAAPLAPALFLSSELHCYGTLHGRPVPVTVVSLLRHSPWEHFSAHAGTIKYDTSDVMKYTYKYTIIFQNRFDLEADH